MELKILGNCQARGIADALSLLVNDVNATGESAPSDINSLEIKLEEILSSQSNLILAKSLHHIISSNIALKRFDLPENIYLPTISFVAFHPDTQYAYLDGSNLNNGLGGHWNSRIMLWAYINEFSQSATQNLFNKHVYHALGYFNLWNSSIESLNQEFLSCEFDFGRWMTKVQRYGIFMYGVNHPTQIGLTQVAIQLAERLFPKTQIKNSFPLDYVNDYLSNVVWPVYPEIGEQLGIQGSYFWRGDETNFANLAEFTQLCFSLFDKLDVHNRKLELFPVMSDEEDRLLHRLANK
jgi:hypothetical protein